MIDLPFTITHQPSGDEAEAEDEQAALLAAWTLLEDNEWRGTCRIWLDGQVKMVMFPPDPSLEPVS